MDKNNLQQLVHDAISSMKGLDTTMLDVRDKTSITDTMFICTGTSNRQVKAIAQKIIEDAKANGFELLGVEGLEQGLWVLIDLGDVIAHVMHPDSREYYQLEKLWSLADEPDQSAQTNP